MKALFLIVALLWGATAQAKGSLGVVVSTPEIFGGYISGWIADDVSLEFRATLSTLDAGITGHMGLSTLPYHRHNLLLSGLAGWVHAGFPDAYDDGVRLAGLMGYGFEGPVDLRLLGGVAVYHDGGWTPGPTFAAMLGWMF